MNPAGATASAKTPPPLRRRAGAAAGPSEWRSVSGGSVSGGSVSGGSVSGGGRSASSSSGPGRCPSAAAPPPAAAPAPRPRGRRGRGVDQQVLIVAADLQRRALQLQHAQLGVTVVLDVAGVLRGAHPGLRNPPRAARPAPGVLAGPAVPRSARWVFAVRRRAARAHPGLRDPPRAARPARRASSQLLLRLAASGGCLQSAGALQHAPRAAGPAPCCASGPWRSRRPSCA